MNYPTSISSCINAPLPISSVCSILCMVAPVVHPHTAMCSFIILFLFSLESLLASVAYISFFKWDFGPPGNRMSHLTLGNDGCE